MIVKKISSQYWQYIIVLFSALLFLPFLGHVHLFDWDEINFAESAREMLITGNWLEVQIDFQTFWEKPPLFIWMQALSMKMFGVNEFAARFPNAICGMVTLLTLFRIGNRMYNREFGILWVLVYVSSFLPFFYFKSGIIDPWFNLFIFLGVFYLFRYFENGNRKHVLLSAMFTGLSVLTKGPVGLLIVGLCMGLYLIVMKFKVKFKFLDLLLFILVFAFFGGFWFLLMLMNGNAELIIDFIQYQIRLFKTEDAGHGGFLLYHFVLVFFGVFPASVFALRGFTKIKNKEERGNFKRLMKILLWLVLILFTIVKTKIAHYSSLVYFPLSYLAAYVLMNFSNRNYRIKNWMKILISVLICFYTIAIVALTFFDSYKDKIINSGKVEDVFAQQSMMANAGWHGFEFLIGIILLLGLSLFFFYLRKGRVRHALASFLFGCLLFVSLSMILIVPRVERYSQNAAIEFYKTKKNADVYVRPLGFKSYAHLFYSQKKIPTHLKSSDESYLLEEDIDKDVFVVIKIQHLQNYLNKYPELKEIYRKNGFVFCERKKKD